MDTADEQARKSKLDDSLVSSFGAFAWSSGLSARDYSTVSILGQGSFGRCCLVLRKGHAYVAKLQKFACLAKSEQEKCRREARIMMECSRTPHPHIVRWRETFQDGVELCIVMEYCNGGTLYDFLQLRKGILLP